MGIPFPRSWSRYLGLRGAALGLAFLLASAFSGCHRKPPTPTTQAAVSVPVGPLPFTGKLTEIDGVTAVISLRHPKLINEDLEKLMAGVPEAALARMALAQLAPYGYPTFSDIAEGSNVGLAVIPPPEGFGPGSKPGVIAFIKLNEGGKIASILGAMRQTLVKHGDWTLVAQDQATIDRLKAPDAVIAYLEHPQREDVRAWVRPDPALRAQLHKQFSASIEPMLAQLPANQQNPARQYLHALVGLLAQVHSGESSLVFTDHDVEIAYGIQFTPDSAIGTGLRYPLPSPDRSAIRIPSDSMINLGIRQSPEGTRVIFDTIFDALLAVDNPPLLEPLKRAKANYASFAKASDGITVGGFDFPFRAGSDASAPTIFSVMTGHFTPETFRAYQQSNQELMSDMIQAIARLQTARFQNARPQGPVTVRGPVPPAEGFSYQQNAVTIGGVSFDTMALRLPVVPASTGTPPEVKTKSFVGVANGAIVTATSQAALERNLPYILGKASPTNFVRVPDEPGVAGRAEVNGGKIMAALADALELNRKDPDVNGQLSALSGAFADAGPVTVDFTVDQAKVGLTEKIPYKFVEACVHFGQYCVAEKADWTKLFPMPVPHQKPPSVANRGEM